MHQTRRIRGVLRTVICFMALLLLTACGQKGDLYLPETLPLLNLIVL